MDEFCHIHVCPLSALDDVLMHSQASWMISLSGPSKGLAQPEPVTHGFLSLEFNDIKTPQAGLIAPNAQHISALIDFAKKWNKQGDLLIHCWMGISRSTAAALIIQALFDPQQDMKLLANRLRHLSPMATPNPLMIALADQHLGLEGHLQQAVADIGRGKEAYEGSPFCMKVAP